MDGKPYAKPISKLPVYVLHVLTGRCENFTSTTVNEIWTWFQSLVDSTVKVKG